MPKGDFKSIQELISFLVREYHQDENTVSSSYMHIIRERIKFLEKLAEEEKKRLEEAKAEMKAKQKSSPRSRPRMR